MSLFVASRRDVVDAADLLAAFGPAAPTEAAARANRSRTLGNHIHFCRWRQVERLIAVLASHEATGTIH
ncbi:MAG TPA: hypothetical protein VF695_01280 [Sphingomonas sp.]|jgi:hypothetical protein